MTVRELIKILSEADPEKLVVVSRDAEGNGYCPLGNVSVENDVFDEDEGEIYLEELTPELVSEGYTDEDVGEGRRCAVLWPGW
jgi:hypothetical protein